VNTERIIRAAFAGVRNSYETHRPVLCEAVLRVPDGIVLELGAGEGSTLPLHEVSLATGRRIVTLESDREWFERFEHLRSNNHAIGYMRSWSELDPVRPLEGDELPYAIAFVDHAPVEQRIVDIRQLAQLAQVVVAHDTNSEDYFNQISGLFRYRTTYKRRLPWTTVFSNFIDVSGWTFEGERLASELPPKFIGDLSSQDARLIQTYAQRASAVLEFGVGGSTQIIAQSIASGTRFLSLDTDPAWIATTEGNLQRLGVRPHVSMQSYDQWNPTPGEQFDLVFNDGAAELRLAFALRCFSHLRIGGHLLFHDTRGLHHVKTVTRVIEEFHESIGRVTFNEAVDGVASNITVLEKKIKEPYVNWNEVEGRPSWAFGHSAVPDEFWR
jgi:predicted O-methyltransferase YrrM